MLSANSVIPIDNDHDLAGNYEDIENPGARNAVKRGDSISLEARGALHHIDADRDGNVTKKELESFVYSAVTNEREKTLLKKALLGMVVILGLFALLICASIYYVVEFSKDAKVDEKDNALRSGENNEIVITENPRVYATLNDLPNMSPLALNSLTELSFTTADGTLHTHGVVGTEISTLESGSTTILFAFGKELQITGDSYLFRTRDFSGIIDEAEVVLITDSNTLNERRRQLVEELSGDESKLLDFMDRCSVTAGVCFHTYDEIKALHKPSPAERTRHGRALDESEYGELTFAEISADVAILNKDSRSGLVRASNFLESIFGLNKTANSIGTTVIKFTMRERCVNYVELADVCLSVPAPELMAATEEPGDLVDATYPYPGLYPDEGKWFFSDEIEYSSDPYTYSLKVRYSHDPLRENRRHVVLMDKADPTHVLTYDEVTTVIDPENDDSLLPQLTTYITNWKEETSVDNEDGASNLLGSRRQLRAEDIFHRHLQTKLKGFPRIHVPESFRGSVNNAGAYYKRSISDGSMAEMFEEDEEEEEEITIEGELTGQHVNGLYDCSNTTANVIDGVLSEREALTLAVNYSGTATSLPVDLNGESWAVPDEQPLDSDDPAVEPMAVFTAPVIETTTTLIHWPLESESVVIEEFDSVAILQRSTLQQLQDLHEGNGTRRLLSDAVADDYERMLDQYNADWLKFEASLRQVREHVSNGAAEFSSRRQLAWTSFQKWWDKLGLSSENKAVIQNVQSNVVEKSWLQKYVEDSFVDALWAKVGESTTQPFVKYTTGLVNDIELHTDCQEYQENLQTLVGYMEKYIYNMQGQIADNGQMILQSLEDKDLENLETKMEAFLSLDENLAPLMPVFARIPYIGPLIKGFRMAYHKTMQTSVEPMEKQLNKLNSLIRDKEIEERLRTFLAKNEKLGKAFYYLDQVMTVPSYMLLIGDAVCYDNADAAAYIVPKCSAFNAKVIAINNVFESIEDQMASVSEFYSYDMTPLARSVDSFLTSSAFKAAEPLVSFLDTAFTAVNKLLEKTITVSVPWVGQNSKQVCATVRYPTGTKYCKKKIKIFGKKKTTKYPCGSNYATRSVCKTVYYPYTYMKKFSFSVMQIINGITGLTSIVTNALDAAVTTVAKALGVSFPDIPLPGLPSSTKIEAVLVRIDELLEVDITDMEYLFDPLLEIMPTWSEVRDNLC